MLDDHFHRGKFDEVTDRADAPIEDAVAMIHHDQVSIALQPLRVHDVPREDGVDVGSRRRVERPARRQHLPPDLQHQREVRDLVLDLHLVVHGLGVTALDVGHGSARQRRLDVHDVLGVDLGLGLLQLAVGDYSGAQSYFEQALSIRRTVLGQEHPDTAASLGDLGSLMESRGEFSTARTYYEMALEMQRKSLGPKHPLTAGSMNRLGGVQLILGDYAGARTNLQDALPILMATFDRQHPAVAVCLMNNATLMMNSGELGRAQKALLQANGILEKTFGPDHPQVAASLYSIGRVMARMGDLDSARRAFERSLSINEKVYGPQHPVVADVLCDLGLLLVTTGDLATARADLERAITIDRARSSVVLGTGTTSPTKNPAIIVTVAFDESTNDFSSADITPTNASVSPLSGSGKNYSFTLTAGSQGAFGAEVLEGKATDPAGNPNAASNYLSLTYDSTGPGVSLISAAGNPTKTASIPVTVTFTEPVSGFTSDEISTTNATVDTFEGSGTTYTFNLIASAPGSVSASHKDSACSAEVRIRFKSSSQSAMNTLEERARRRAVFSAGVASGAGIARARSSQREPSRQ